MTTPPWPRSSPHSAGGKASARESRGSWPRTSSRRPCRPPASSPRPLPPTRPWAPSRRPSAICLPPSKVRPTTSSGRACLSTRSARRTTTRARRGFWPDFAWTTPRAVSTTCRPPIGAMSLSRLPNVTWRRTRPSRQMVPLPRLVWSWSRFPTRRTTRPSSSVTSRRMLASWIPTASFCRPHRVITISARAAPTSSMPMICSRCSVRQQPAPFSPPAVLSASVFWASSTKTSAYRNLIHCRNLRPIPRC
mmetsp:Transcript_13836/g.23001  ORF Transcript_13836/g.23001 Transcript_13836/m.23001 type:complete len:249 (-) Transcript_13836:576-1322(-)